MARKFEETLQINCVRIFRYKYPKLTGLFFAIPNGGSRHPIEAFNLKMQGVLPGVADLMLAVPSGDSHGLFMELKAGKNKQTETQIEFEKNVISQGYTYKIVRSVTEFEEVVNSYLLSVNST